MRAKTQYANSCPFFGACEKSWVLYTSNILKLKTNSSILLAPSLLEAPNKHSTDRWTNLPPISTNFKDSTKQKLLLGGIRNFPTNWAILRGKQICMTTHKRFETISKHNNIVGVDIKATKQSKKCLKTKAKQFVDQILLLMLSISWNSSDATSGMIKKICHNFFMSVDITNTMRL